jgi:hypothetical protein
LVVVPVAADAPELRELARLATEELKDDAREEREEQSGDAREEADESVPVRVDAREGPRRRGRMLLSLPRWKERMCRMLLRKLQRMEGRMQ